MITKSDWQAVYDEMMAEDRSKLGPPPAAEEMLAYSRGELSTEEAGRVRALLVCYPDLARALTEPFPADDAKPGDPGFLSQDELTQRFASLQKSIHGSETRPAARPEGRVLPFRTAWLAMAAAVALVFAGLYVWTESKSAQTRAIQVEYLEPADGQRGVGGEGRVLSPNGDVVFVLSMSDPRPFDTYRVVMTAVANDGRVQTVERVPLKGDALSVLVPGAFLKPGKYQIVAYGVDDGNKELLGNYVVRVLAR